MLFTLEMLFFKLIFLSANLFWTLIISCHINFIPNLEFPSQHSRCKQNHAPVCFTTKHNKTLRLTLKFWSTITNVILKPYKKHKFWLKLWICPFICYVLKILVLPMWIYISGFATFNEKIWISLGLCSSPLDPIYASSKFGVVGFTLSHAVCNNKSLVDILSGILS